MAEAASAGSILAQLKSVNVHYLILPHTSRALTSIKAVDEETEDLPVNANQPSIETRSSSRLRRSIGITSASSCAKDFADRKLRSSNLIPSGYDAGARTDTTRRQVRGSRRHRGQRLHSKAGYAGRTSTRLDSNLQLPAHTGEEAEVYLTAGRAVAGDEADCQFRNHSNRTSLV
jgi:hypothetical protein